MSCKKSKNIEMISWRARESRKQFGVMKDSRRDRYLLSAVAPKMPQSVRRLLEASKQFV